MSLVVEAYQIYDRFTLGLLLLARIGAFIAAAPVIENQAVPGPLKLYLALIVTLLTLPLVEVTAPANLLPDGALLIGAQVLIGLAMGFALRMVFAVVQLGGYLIAQQMGLGFAVLQDPQNGEQVPLMNQFYTLVVTLVFLGLNGHLQVIEALVRSFQWLPVGAPMPVGLIEQILQWSGGIFSTAVAVTLPVVTTLLLVNLCFGVMSRAAPQLNVLVIGFPITLLLGFVLVAVTLPSFVGTLTDRLFGATAGLRTLLGGG